MEISQDALNKIKNAAEHKGEQVLLDKASEAADRFIKVLQDEIENCAGTTYGKGELGPTAVAFLKDLGHGEVRKVGNGQYVIDVNFLGDKHRESLYPEDDRPYTNPYPEGVDNIVAVLNNGYSARDFVYGRWHGIRLKSLDQRAGAHFLQNARDVFMSLYAKDYGVTTVTLSDEYER